MIKQVTMTEEKRIDELVEKWVANRFQDDTNITPEIRPKTYQDLSGDTKAEFCRWLVDHYGMWSGIRNEDETSSHRCVVVTIEMLVDNRLTNAVLGRLVKDDASQGLGDILNVVVTDKKPVRFVEGKDVLLEDEK